MEWKNSTAAKSRRPALELLPHQHSGPKKPKTTRSCRISNERSYANIQKTVPTAYPAHVGRRDYTAESSRNRRRRPTNTKPDRQGHGRFIDYCVAAEDLLTGKDIGMPSGYCLCQSAAHRQNLRRKLNGAGWAHKTHRKDLNVPCGACTPHSNKFAVGCPPRNCAESGIKDVGVIGVDSG
jgi:nitrite reductase (NADH) large subunit